MDTPVYKPRAVQVASGGFALFGGFAVVTSIYSGLGSLDASFDVIFESLFIFSFGVLLLTAFAFIELKVRNGRRFVLSITSVAFTAVVLGTLVLVAEGSIGALASIVGLAFYGHVFYRFRHDDIKDYFVEVSGPEDVPYPVVFTGILSAIAALFFFSVVGFFLDDSEFRDIGWVAFAVGAIPVCGHILVTIGVLTRWNWTRVLALILVAVYTFVVVIGTAFVGWFDPSAGLMTVGMIVGLTGPFGVFAVVALTRADAVAYYEADVIKVPKNVEGVFK